MKLLYNSNVLHYLCREKRDNNCLFTLIKKNYEREKYFDSGFVRNPDAFEL